MLQVDCVAIGTQVYANCDSGCLIVDSPFVCRYGVTALVDQAAFVEPAKQVTPQSVRSGSRPIRLY